MWQRYNFYQYFTKMKLFICFHVILILYRDFMLLNIFLAQRVFLIKKMYFCKP